MIEKFNIKIDDNHLNKCFTNSEINRYESLSYNYNREKLIKKIKSIAVVDDIKKEVTIKHTDILNDWFPDSECHVFLSHSHKDKNIAIKIANYLYHNYKIKTFIDSDFWQFVDDAINDINREYSRCQKDNDDLLRYDSCLMVATNFYLTLSNALMNAIDRSDCCLFLNTSNSIKNINTKQEATYSPWIYTELNILEKIRLNPHEDRKIRSEPGMESYFEKEITASYPKQLAEDHKLNFEYAVDPSFKLPTIDENTIALILSSPEKIIPNYYEIKKLSERDESSDFIHKLEKITAIHCLDILYEFIRRDLPKVRGSTNI